MTLLPPTPTRRLFIGLLPDDAVAQAVLEWRARWAWPAKVALAAPAHVHLTMAFLGEVDEGLRASLQAGLSAVPFEAFALRLSGAQVWPSGVAVLRPAPEPGLEALHARLAGVLASLGLGAVTRRWKPHVTLARKAQAARPPAQASDITWPVTGFGLVWSRLPPQVPTAKYELLGWWGQGAAPSRWTAASPGHEVARLERVKGTSPISQPVD